MLRRRSCGSVWHGRSGRLGRAFGPRRPESDVRSNAGRCSVFLQSVLTRPSHARRKVLTFDAWRFRPRNCRLFASSGATRSTTRSRRAAWRRCTSAACAGRSASRGRSRSSGCTRSSPRSPSSSRCSSTRRASPRGSATRTSCRRSTSSRTTASSSSSWSTCRASRSRGLMRATRDSARSTPRPASRRRSSSASSHGLHAAHEATSEQGEPLGIVHRDVSPQNVLVGTDGVARVLDFGVAKAAGRIQTTREGQLKGKLALHGARADRRQQHARHRRVRRGRRPLGDARGAPPVSRRNRLQTFSNILTGEIVPPSKHTPKVPAEIDAVVMKGLARVPRRASRPRAKWRARSSASLGSPRRPTWASGSSRSPGPTFMRAPARSWRWRARERSRSRRPRRRSRSTRAPPASRRASLGLDQTTGSGAPLPTSPPASRRAFLG